MKTIANVVAETILIGIAAVSCISQSPEARLNQLGPVSGGDEVTYVVSSPEGSVGLDSVADVARSIGRYRRLNLSEGEKIQRLAQQKFDGFVIQEVRNLQPKYEARKREIQRKSQKLAKETPSQVDKIRQKEEAELSRLKEEIREQAIIAVKRRYGSQIAVPLRTRDNKPAVAISKVRGDRLQVPTTALELNKKPGSTIQHQGKSTPVTGGEIKIP